MKDPNRIAEAKSGRPVLLMLGVADLVRGIDNWRVSHLMIAFSTTRRFWQPDQNSSSEHYRVSLSPFALLLTARNTARPAAGRL
jgi:hypothetical protein